MNEKIFDLNKARQVGKDGKVENVDLSEGATKGNIGRDLQELGGLLKGATEEDYDAIFEGAPINMLQHFQGMTDQLARNLERIIKKRKEGGE